jgi:hypothetical protein
MACSVKRAHHLAWPTATWNTHGWWDRPYIVLGRSNVQGTCVRIHSIRCRVEEQHLGWEIEGVEKRASELVRVPQWELQDGLHGITPYEALSLHRSII